MPKKGQVLVDESSGNIYEFIETAADTGGERITIRMTLNKKGKVAPDHIHVLQQETFKVLSGRMTYLLNGEKNYLQAGESIVLPKNQPHNHYNTAEEPLVLEQVIEPAFDTDFFIENLIGMTSDGKVKNGQTSFLQSMVTVRYMEAPSFLANIPRAPQKVLVAIFGPIARLFGYRAFYKKYTGIEK